MPVRQACRAVQAGFEAVSTESAQDDAGGATEAAEGPEEGGHGWLSCSCVMMSGYGGLGRGCEMEVRWK